MLLKYYYTTSQKINSMKKNSSYVNINEKVSQRIKTEVIFNLSLKHFCSCILCLSLFTSTLLRGQNPIIPNKGANDPHIRIINDKAYLSASHDREIGNTTFIMDDWWLWESNDLINWKLISTLKPEETYIGKPYTSCWATDLVKRNNKYYWYFSEGNHQTGVMVADSPEGPWSDPLGKPLLTENMTPTHEYDIGIVEDKKGDFYIVFGVWDFYIAKLNEDMISLSEKPKKITIHNEKGPYNLDGKSETMKTDDKPFIHIYNNIFYLSWGCFYGMSESIYGPYECKGSIIEKESFAPGYDKPTWPSGFKQGRHGSFFEWHNQWYFAYCDISQTGNRYFRDTFISYVNYKKNGEMALIRIDATGVGNYNVDNGAILAVDYFKTSGTTKTEIENGVFVVDHIDNNDFLTFQNTKGLLGKTKISFDALENKDVAIEVHLDSPNGEIIATHNLNKRSKKRRSKSYEYDFSLKKDNANLCFVFKGAEDNLLVLKSIDFK